MTSLAEQWESLGRSGLLGVGLPSRFGGQGGGVTEIWKTARRVGNSSFDLGVGLSWVHHHMAARFPIGKFGTDDQKAAWLPRLSSGESMAALAIEEADTTADTWNLQSGAEPLVDDMYLIHAVKTNVINAPVADLMILFVPTPTNGDPEAISAFLVHRDTPGVHFEPAPERSYCPTSPHSTVVFDGCRIPAASRLGEPGAGRQMLSYVEERRDVLILQIIGGYLARLLEEVKPLLQRSDHDRMSLLSCAGRLLALQALNARIAESWNPEDALTLEMAAAQIASRELVRRTREALGDLPPHSAILAAQRDLDVISINWPRTRKRLLRAARAASDAEASGPDR